MVHGGWWAGMEAELALDASRRASLVRAVETGDLLTVTELIEGDHDMAFHTLNRMKTLLVVAVEHSQLAVAQYLIERGVDVNKHSRRSPLHAAARLPDGRPFIRLLARHKARLWSKGCGAACGSSPLHYAAIKKRVGNARLLAELGADPAWRDGHGMTPLDYCGAGSAVGRAIKEGVAVKEIRDAMRRLFFASTVADTADFKKEAAIAAAREDCDGEEGAGGGGGKRRRKGKDARSLSWREARRQRGRPFPAVAFVHDTVEEVVGAGKKAAAARETGRLLQGVFVHIPLDVRRQIVLFV